MTMEAIKAAIQGLPEAEQLQLVDWFVELKECDWDAQMERDFSLNGRGHHLVEKINQEINEGKFTSFEEGFKSRQKTE